MNTLFERKNSIFRLIISFKSCAKRQVSKNLDLFVIPKNNGEI
jgi:hypothetical protein